MVEGGRLEIVLAAMNCHVGSNPTLSAILTTWRILFTLKYVTEAARRGELSEWSMVNGWKPFVVSKPPEVQILYSPPLNILKPV